MFDKNKGFFSVSFDGKTIEVSWMVTFMSSSGEDSWQEDPMPSDLPTDIELKIEEFNVCECVCVRLW